MGLQILNAVREWFASGQWALWLITLVGAGIIGAGIGHWVNGTKRALARKEEDLMKKVDEHLKPTFDTFAKVLSDIKVELEESKKRDARSDRAMLQIMRSNLHRLFDECKGRGFTTDIDRSRFNDLFASYTELGGNHEMETIHKAFVALPDEKVFNANKNK